MEIAGLTLAQHAEFLALVDAEIRPPHAVTRPWDDFPLALDRANLPWLLGATDGSGRLAGGLSILVRTFATSCGDLPVAAVGSVVTRPDCRGRGVSAGLQAAALALLARQDVPLAALWTDQPEIYAGRGFRPAGWEWHADLESASLPLAAPEGVVVRNWAPADAGAAAALHDRHPWRTRRSPQDAACLYGMPGTRGLVAATGAGVAATVFCGKGADFPQYVAEWAGDPGLVLCLLGEARRRGWAGSVLIPAGAEDLAMRLDAAGARLWAVPSACWSLVRRDLVAAAVDGAGGSRPGADDGPADWLGGVGADGVVNPGPLTVAVWGFDST